jgi:Predicted Zn-dependent peptidases
MRILKQKWAITITLLFSAITICAQMTSPPAPFDSKVRYGKLENGLTYYIIANQEPKERAEFYIVQNVGASLEEDNQNGLAHFLEHMAFNGTKNFPDKGIIEYFESIGVRFGQEINAYTSLDETVYNLSHIPTYREEVIDSALLVLHDWSSFISLEGEEIDNERGVIREEWRTGASASRRMWKKLNPLKYPNSQYAKRDVIGDTAVINNFAHQDLRDFYHKWYRPDLQAIIIVGDLDVDKIEAKIKTLFSDIPKAPNFGERPISQIEDNAEPIIAIVTDKEARYAQVTLEYKKDVPSAEEKKSVAGYYMFVINNLISSMANNRFSELAQQPNASFVAGYSYYANAVKPKDAFFMIVIPKDGEEKQGTHDLMLEAEKIKRFGFTNSEFIRAKTDYLTAIEKSYNERDTRKNNSYVQELIRHFLEDEPVPGIEWEYEVSQGLLAQLPLEAVNEIAKSYITRENLIISITAPEKEVSTLPTEKEILESLKSAETTQLTAREEEDLSKPLISEIPKAGTIVEETENTEFGTTEWLLSNGVKIVLKPTDFKKDEIIMTAFSKGGFSKIDEKDLPSAYFAADIVSSNGLGEFNKIDLGKTLTGKIANVSSDISAYAERLNGSSSVKDFETMLQLIYLNYTGVRNDDNGYKAFINMLKTSLANIEKDPNKAFSDTINLTLASFHPRHIIFNTDIIEKVDQDVALKVYRERFSDPANFTFIFTGNIDPKNEDMRNAVATYIGGLASEQKTETYTDHNIRTPKGDVKNSFKQKMEIKKSSNFICYSADMPFNLQNSVVLKAIENLLFDRYLESIREKEGGSYGVRVNAGINHIPTESAILYMTFDTDPEKQERLIAIIYDEVNDLVANGPRPESIKKIQENMLKKYDENLRENGWWQSVLTSYIYSGINQIRDYKNVVNALTPELIQETLKQIVVQKNIVEVVMNPED